LFFIGEHCPNGDTPSIFTSAIEGDVFTLSINSQYRSEFLSLMDNEPERFAEPSLTVQVLLNPEYISTSELMSLEIKSKQINHVVVSVVHRSDSTVIQKYQVLYYTIFCIILCILVKQEFQ
jgi:hypothetical protein